MSSVITVDLSDIVEPPYHSDLVRIREEFETHGSPNFPKDQCGLVARAVKDDLDFLEIGGLYLGHRQHIWNYDPKRKLYIDLTMDQFGHVTEKVIILPEKNPVLEMLWWGTLRARSLKYKSRYRKE